MSTRILTIEDSIDCHDLIRLALGHRYQLVFATTAREALDVLHREAFDLVLLDVGLPDETGFNLISKLRATPFFTEQTPVIFLTASSDTESLVAGFSLGADDYITKPFQSLELLARIEAKISKYQKDRAETRLERGPLSIDIPRQRVHLNEGAKSRDVHPTPIELRILSRLAQQPGRVLSRQQLIDSVWGHGTFIEERVVDKHISSLRKKIQPYHDSIRTIPNSGYEFLTPNLQDTIMQGAGGQA